MDLKCVCSPDSHTYCHKCVGHSSQVLYPNWQQSLDSNYQLPSVEQPLLTTTGQYYPINQSLLPAAIPPVGIFWDIENCQVPYNRSAVQLVERIRQLCFDRQYREYEFLVVCDTHKISDQLLNDLNDTQVTVVHVNSVAKNAADDKIRQQIQRFIEANGYASAVVMITDDINFAPVLSDLRNRGRVQITLIQRHAAPALRNSADSVLCFEDFCKDLEYRCKMQYKGID